MKNLMKSFLIFAAVVSVYFSACSAESEVKYVEKEVKVEVEKIVYKNAVAQDGTYSVYHLQQDKTGSKAFSDYKMKDFENDRQLSAGDDLSCLAQEYEGFTPKALTQNEDIIYVFYDRNIITYTFVSGTEGSFKDGSESIAVSGVFEGTLVYPEIPESDEYRFVKYLSGETEVPEIFGSEDLTFNAVWSDELFPEGFVLINGIDITGSETWTPVSKVFVQDRSISIPDLVVCDHVVTRGEYFAVTGKTPSKAGAYDKELNSLTGDDALNNPVDSVSWYEAIIYCNKLSEKEHLEPCYSLEVDDVETTDTDLWGIVPNTQSTTWDGIKCSFTSTGYRLPTEAEWEWLARGGQTFKYAGSNTVDEVCWYKVNTTIKNEDGTETTTGTITVKSKPANNYGLFDMSGNVWEFCWDWNGTPDSNTKAEGPDEGTTRIRRGGSWNLPVYYSEITFRGQSNPSTRSNFVGFRVVRIYK